MAKTTRSTVRLSETDRSFLETLGKFCVRARHSSWDNPTHTNDVEAVTLLNEMSPMLTNSEYRSLMNGWGDIRMQSDESVLNSAVESITKRIQERSESF